MPDFHSWHKDRMDFGELPTVRDVLAAADPALVADALHPRYARLAASEGGEPPGLSEVRADLEAALAEMLAAPVAAPDGEWVLVASTGVFRELEPDDALRVRTEATLVMRGDLPLYARYLEGDYRPDPFSGEAPINGWAFELSPWEEILAYRAWVPERMCEREAYQFVADVVWEMTLFGSGRDDAEDRRAEFAKGLERSVAEAEGARAEGGLDEAVSPYGPAAELSALGTQSGELDYMRRMTDVEDVIAATLRRTFHRDCVELSRRLGMEGAGDS